MNLEDLTFRSLAVHRGGSEAGYFSVNPRPYAAISFRLNGSGEFTVNGKRLTASEGDVLFLPANTPYEVEYSVNRFIVIHLWDCDRFEAEVLRFSSPQTVKLHFLRLLEAQNNGASKLQMKAHVYGLLDLMLGEKWKASPSPVLSRCVAYLEENFTDSTVNVDSLCRSVFFSRSTLQREFRRCLGISPHGYLSRLRLERSLQLLAEGVSVKEASQKSGFSDEKYFSRVFLRAYGCLPSQMRFKE